MPRTSTVRRAPRFGPRLTLGHALLAAAMIMVVTMPFASRALGSVTTAQRNEMVRYAWETDDLTYSAFLARKADFTRAGCNADSPKRGGCTKPKPYDSFVWTTDGCSIPLVKFAYRTLFAGPCEQHDFAYRNIGKGLALDRSNSARKRVDSKLHIEARRVCRDKYSSLKRVFNLAACLDQAEVMWSFFTLPAWGPPKGPENWDKACPRGACWPPAVVDPRPTSAAPGPPASNPAPPVAAAPGPDPTPSGPNGSPSDVPAGSVAETAGGVAHTWTDPASAGGAQGPSVQGGQTVGIACKLQGFRVADGNTWWYRIASSPWNGAYYVSADAFYNNGATSGSLIGTPFVDPAVATC